MSDSINPSSNVYLASFGALLGALSMGLALGYTSPAFSNMANNPDSGPLDVKDKDKFEGQKSLIGSMLAVGALVGGIIGEPCNNMLGRRLSLIIYGLPFIVGWILIAVSNSMALLIIGRLLTGLCCGLVSGTAPTYVVEIAPPKIRGLLGTCFQVMVVIGILLASVFGLVLNWRYLAALSLVPSIVMSLIMFFMPETPQWLLSKARNEEAEQSLSLLRSSPVAPELANLTQSAQNARQAGRAQYSLELISSKEFMKPLWMALGLMFFQQFSGINAILFYQTDIFKEASPSLNPDHSAIMVNIAQVLMTLLGSFLVDRLGRRILLMTSGAGHAISLLIFGIYKWQSREPDFPTQAYAWVALVSLIVFISSFSIGFGPVPWMMIPEFSSSRVRSLVSSIATAFNWTCVFIVTGTVKQLIDTWGNAATYWIFATICVISCVFVFLALPETKGKTSDQIQEELFGPNAASQQSAVKQTQGQPMKELA